MTSLFPKLKYFEFCNFLNAQFLYYDGICPFCRFYFFKVGLSPYKKNCVICFIERPLKVMKNAFYFIVKALFVLNLFKVLSLLFDHEEKMAWLVS